MEEKDKIMVDKIKNILTEGSKQGINPLFIASYIQGKPKGLNSKVMGKLKKSMMENSITISQVKEFINKKQYDIYSLINEVEQERDYSIEESEEEEDMEKEKEIIVEEVNPQDESEVLNEDNERIDDIEEQLDNMGLEEIDITDLDKGAELSEKAKKLEEKIDLLCEKVEQEKSPVKRHMFTFQIRMLVSKLQREIDLQNIKAKYDIKKGRLEDRKKRREIKAIDKITDLDEDIKYLKNVIKGNEQYDYKSKSFLYPKDYVENSGGVEEFTKKLRQSKKESTQKVAEKIDLISEARQELEKLKEQQRKQSAILRDSNNDYKMEINSLNFKEKALTISKKVNIFSRIGAFFGATFEEVKDILEENKELRELKKQQKQEIKDLKEETKRQIEEIKKEQVAKKEEQIKQQQSQKEDILANKGRDVAAKFRSSNYVPEEQRIENITVEPTVEAEQVVEQVQPQGQEPGDE